MSDLRDLEAPAPVRLATARSGARYGAVLLVLVLAVVAGALVFAYAYLAANTDPWRPDGVASPSWWAPALAATATVLAALVLSVGWLPAARGGAPRLAACGLLGVVAVAAALVALVGHPFGRDAHAYGAATYLLQATAGALILLPTLGAGLVAAFTFDEGHTAAARADAVGVLRILWWGSAVLAPLLLATTLLGGA